MKKKFTFQNVLLFALILAGIYKFSYLSAVKSEKSYFVMGDTLGFINYVTAPGWVDTAPGNYWNITNQFDSYKELNFNTAQMFVSEDSSMGFFNQNFLTPEQKDSLNRIISMSNQAGLNCYLERVRISALCYSQRLIYEVESGNNNTSTNYGFVYRNNMDSVFGYDSDRTVLAPKAGIDSPGILCDSIYENLQHTDLYYFWPGSTDNFRWKIKPVMKIDSSIFSTGDTTPVVAIYTKNYLGNDIDTTIIRVNSFGLNSYSGNYIQSYFRLDHLFEVNGHIDSANGLSYGRPKPGDPIKDCKVDFQVYWYGLVDVWFDKMIVDDERADQLFGKDFAGNYDTKIKDASTPENYYFIMNLIKDKKYTMSNIMPINYVLNKMHEELVRKDLLPSGFASIY